MRKGAPREGPQNWPAQVYHEYNFVDPGSGDRKVDFTYSVL